MVQCIAITVSRGVCTKLRFLRGLGQCLGLNQAAHRDGICINGDLKLAVSGTCRKDY